MKTSTILKKTPTSHMLTVAIGLLGIGTQILAYGYCDPRNFEIQ